VGCLHSVRRPKGGGRHTSPCREGIPLPGKRTQGVRQGTALQRTFRHNSADEGKIELLEPVDLPEGTTVLVTPLIEEDTLFWARVSHVALDAIWDNAEDDVYAQLLKE
jgi:hypothetical protein